MIFVSAIRKLRSSQRQQTNRFDKITKGVIQGVKRYYLRTSSGIQYRPPYPQGCSFQHGVMERLCDWGVPVLNIKYCLQPIGGFFGFFIHIVAIYCSYHATLYIFKNTKEKKRNTNIYTKQKYFQ